MAATSAFTSTSSITRAALVLKAPTVRSVTVLGLSSKNNEKCSKVINCSIMEKKSPPENKSLRTGAAASSLLAAAWAAVVSSPNAVALVDERMSTEGTGLPFGLSNNLLGWILLGVFTLVWALYTVYTSTLDEDDDSGLSL